MPLHVGATGDDEIYSHLSQDPSVVIHESVHALVDVVAGLPFEGEGGSLNEGFADYFTAVQLNNPNMAEASYLKGPFRRSVVNSVTLNDKNGGLYHDSAIVSGTLWDLRERFGNIVGLRLASLTLNRLVPGSDFKDFGDSLHVVLESELGNAGDLQAGKEILRKRGFQ
jgi:Zn-dependent metalloprotease